MIGLRACLVIAAAGLGLAGCTDGYGYSGVSVGYGSAGYGGYGDYGGYYDSGYYGYDGAYGAPYWGWYGDYYYPGTGYYVYDRYNRRTQWNDYQRRYWEGRRNSWRGDRGAVRDNWQHYRQDRRGDDRGSWSDRRDGRPDGRGTWSGRRDDRQGAATREQYRTERREAPPTWNGGQRQDRPQPRAEGRRGRRN